ncbi:MAG: dihydropteroate synthase [Euryarchaeota archaeon]|nr:dihydropteroate synthase [Euryarchaeota archaeon]
MSENLTPQSKRGSVISSKINRTPNGNCFLMGILNVTPDSFFSESRVSGVENAVIKAKLMIEQGATWIDIGGESTRPGAETITIDEEINRVIPLISKLRELNPDIMISIDTRNHQVARRALESGADMVNDVSGLRSNEMMELVLEFGCAVCIMHMQGVPSNMQTNPSYDNVVDEVIDYLENKAQLLVDKGHPKDLIVIDPGIGFGKNHEQNIALMKSTKRLKESGFAVLWGTSRKSVIGLITGKKDATNRLSGTLGTSAYAHAEGVDILRVHDVDEHQDFFKVLNTLQN